MSIRREIFPTPLPETKLNRALPTMAIRFEMCNLIYAGALQTPRTRSKAGKDIKFTKHTAKRSCARSASFGKLVYRTASKEGSLIEYLYTCAIGFLLCCGDALAASSSPLLTCLQLFNTFRNYFNSGARNCLHDCFRQVQCKIVHGSKASVQNMWSETPAKMQHERTVGKSAAPNLIFASKHQRVVMRNSTTR